MFVVLFILVCVVFVSCLFSILVHCFVTAEINLFKDDILFVVFDAPAAPSPAVLPFPAMLLFVVLARQFPRRTSRRGASLTSFHRRSQNRLIYI